jgi:FMN phosphatase YigB (HAD superfamily)
MNPLQAIIFDCFGVLASDGWLPFRDFHFGDKPELLEQANAVNMKADAGIVNKDEFINTIAKLAGVSRQVVSETVDDNLADSRLLDFIRQELKPHYKIGMLSNAGADWLDEIFTPEQLSTFDAKALSYEIGAIKPDPLAYQTICKRLKVEPEHCLFIDDQDRYCQGGRDAGMQVIRYEGFDQLLRDIQPLLVKS